MTGRARPVSWSIVVLVVAAVISGCVQRESKDEYKLDAKKVYDQRLASVQSLNSIDRADAASFRASAKQIRKAANELESIAPPGEVQVAHTLYVRSLREYAKVLDLFAGCARIYATDSGRGMECRRNIPQGLVDDTENDYANAISIYKEKGYTFPMLEKPT